MSTIAKDLSARPYDGPFKVGDHVIWSSQANAYAKVKIGEVVEVVRAGERPSSPRFASLLVRSGNSRNHESYVVEVRGGTRGQATTHYWPLTRNLRRHDIHIENN